MQNVQPAAFARLQNLAARQEALLQVCKTLPHAGKRFCKLAKPCRTPGSASANLQDLTPFVT